MSARRKVCGSMGVVGRVRGNGGGEERCLDARKPKIGDEDDGKKWKGRKDVSEGERTSG